MRKLYRHPDGSLELVTFVDESATAQAFYRNAVEIPIPSPLPPRDTRAFWQAPNGVLEVNISAYNADKAKDKRSREQKLIEALIAKGIITPQDVS